MIRLFTGLSVPDDMRQKLAAVQGGIPGMRWTPPENFHVTLTFIGDVPENTAEDIDEALLAVQVESFDMHVRGMGSFAQGDHPQVLWAGVDHGDALFALRHKIDNVFERYSIAHEKRKYTPHVTLARMKEPDMDRLPAFIAEHQKFDAGITPVSSFILYRTHQTKNGHYYEEVAEYPLLPPRA